MHALVLSRRDFREYDQMISVYTKERGKLELLARGVKKITSKNAPHLAGFSIVDIDVVKGKELDHLITAQEVESFAHIWADMTKSVAAQYVVSLTDKLTHAGERDERLYELVCGWFKYVNDVEEVNPFLLDGYIVTLLHCLGFTPVLEHCVVCDAINELDGFYFAGGGVVCTTCGNEKKRTSERVVSCNQAVQECMQILLSGNWQIINDIQLHEQQKNQLHRLVYDFLIFHSERALSDWKMVSLNYSLYPEFIEGSRKK